MDRRLYKWQDRRRRIAARVRAVADTLPLPDGWVWWTTIGLRADGSETWAHVVAPEGPDLPRVRGAVVRGTGRVFLSKSIRHNSTQAQWEEQTGIVSSNLWIVMSDCRKRAVLRC